MMHYISALRYASHSAVVLAAVSSAASTVGYVVYKDYTRYRVMIDTFATGNMVEPFKVLIRSMKIANCLKRAQRVGTIKLLEGVHLPYPVAF